MSDRSKKMSHGKNAPNKPRIATLDTLRSPENNSDEEGQRFYVGGSSRSGQQVLGPSKKKRNTSEMISNIFKAAKEHGAEVVEKSEERTHSPLLTNEYGEGTSSDVKAQSHEPLSIILKMWSNGFSVDDGPLRDFSDPESREFLDSIAKGEIPRELVRSAKGREISLNMEDHHTEEYIVPKKPIAAFTGTGHRLGAVTPETISSSIPMPNNQSNSANEKVAKERIKTDESKPTTSIQIRLADGSRLKIKLNITHTIQDIRNYICDARPDFAPRPFILMTTFPNRQLTEEGLTIEQAGLQNSTLTQKFV